MPTMVAPSTETCGWLCRVSSSLLDGAPEIVLDHPLELQRAVHLRLEEGIAVTAAVLGLVEGGVGELEEGLAVGGVTRGHGDTDRAADGDLDIHDDEGLGEAGEDALAERCAAGLRRQMGADDAELVTAEARDGIARLQRAGERRRATCRISSSPAVWP